MVNNKNALPLYIQMYAWLSKHLTNTEIHQTIQSIMQYNGGSVVAMVGKDCVAIAADKRLGAQFMTVSTEFQKMFKASEKTFIGLPGLASDVLTL